MLMLNKDIYVPGNQINTLGDLNYDTLYEVFEDLFANDVLMYEYTDVIYGAAPAAVAYFGYINPKNKSSIESIPSFIPVSDYPIGIGLCKPLDKEIGLVANIRFFEDETIKVFTAHEIAIIGYFEGDKKNTRTIEFKKSN